MSNIQLYWDGNTGLAEYETRKTFLTTKPTIPTVSFDYIIYSETDNVKRKVYNGVRYELTDDEVDFIKAYCNSHAINTNTSLETLSGLITDHNSSTTAHHDIRVQLSNLHEFAHRVASVWSTELSLEDYNKEEFKIPWNYVIGDSINCTDATDSTNWKCPVSETYDIRIRLGFEGVDTSEDVDVTITLKKIRGEAESSIRTGTITIPQNAVGLPMVQLEAFGIILEEGDNVVVTAKITSASGLIVPSRTFFTVDNHGAVMAQRQADYFYNTLGNLVFYNGYEATLNGDSSGTAQVVANKWNTSVVSI